MKLLQNNTRAGAPDADYPFGYIVDEDGSNNGTFIDSNFLNDLWQLKEKMFDQSGITANGLPDNQTNGFQLFEAFMKVLKPYKMATISVTQTGTNAPVITEIGPNDIGTITGEYTTTGSYKLVSTGNFDTGKTFVVNGQSTETDSIVKATPATVNYISLASYVATTGSSANGKITSMHIQIMVFD
jgi:hypothetical protein